MAQVGYTPIQLYYSPTASAVPIAGNLLDGELAINILDEKLYFKNAAGVVKLLASLNSTPFTGTPTAPTAAPGTNTTQLATTEFVLTNSASTGKAIAMAMIFGF
jgi:hypothetical protein